MHNTPIYICLLFLLNLFCGNINAQERTKFTPGQEWNDVNGKHINAHGSSILLHNGKYYWYGEDRTGMKSNGVSCYSSEDLYNWKREGMALSATGTPREDLNDISDGRLLERPKVIYNTQTGKFVMWSHWEKSSGNYSAARVCVATADTPEGPFSLYKTFRPQNSESRDQTLFLDSNGKAYHICSTDMNRNTLISLLSKDYQEPTCQMNKILIDRQCEAATILREGDCYFGLFSGCTGWAPNPGRIAYSFDMLGEWNYPGMNFAVDANRSTTYRSQSACVIKLENKEKAFIYVGDRWNPKDVEHSTQIWLPISLRSGYPTVRWYDEWDLSVFDNMYRYKRASDITKGHKYVLLEKNSNRLVSYSGKGIFSIEDDNDTLNLTIQFIRTKQPNVYKIKCTQTGKYIDTANDTLYLGKANNANTQLWQLELQHDGYYKIKNLGTAKYLSVSNAETQAGTSLSLSATSGKDSQAFAVYFDSSKYHYPAADIFSKEYYTKIAATITDTSK